MVGGFTFGYTRIALYTRKSGGTPATEMFYFIRDPLGSLDSMTDRAGAVQVRLSYNALGLRRQEAGWSGAVPNADWTRIYAITHRGLTDHEMLDDLDVIHMNGRLYDPDSGRFVSADPPDRGLLKTNRRPSAAALLQESISVALSRGRGIRNPTRPCAGHLALRQALFRGLLVASHLLSRQVM